MPGTLPEGEPVPRNGSLPASATQELGNTPFGVYVHVPFCRARCGYCDFNTYTATELGGGASQAAYPDLVTQEIDLAAAVLPRTTPQVSAIFFGGGTPTLLAPERLGQMIQKINMNFGLAPDAEVTVEANPETVGPAELDRLLAAGVTRLSFGMQSAVPHVLRVLDRDHQPGRPADCVRWAREAGFEHVSLDLIYGTPGESDADWDESVRAALAAGPDHVSAYALIVEDGTRLAAKIARGELTRPDDDAMADRYLAADAAFAAAGMSWYELSNWATGPGSACQHNLLYWTDGNWWGIGPGAHSHVSGTRWWNLRHPAAYAQRVSAEVSPGQAREVLTDEDRRLERILLTTRLATGCPVTDLRPAGRAAAEGAVTAGLAQASALAAGRVVLTTRGRLLADAVIRDLTD